MKQKALVVEGGGMRGVFAAGVLDYFLLNDLHYFDFCLGVSAGSTNLSSWMSKQLKRSYRVIVDYSCRPDFINKKRAFTGGSMMDLDWLWDITLKEIPYDFDAFAQHESTFYIVVTPEDTGVAEYIRADRDNLIDLLKGSCALPLAYRGHALYNNRRMFDGGVADPIPVKKAYELGARDITVVLSQKIGYRKKKSKLSKPLSKIIYRSEGIRNAMNIRDEVYNESLDFITNPPSDCTIHTIAPSDEFDVSRMTIDINKLEAGYKIGLEAGEAYKESLSLI